MQVVAFGSGVSLMCGKPIPLSIASPGSSLLGPQQDLAETHTETSNATPGRVTECHGGKGREKIGHPLIVQKQKGGDRIGD